ncbi:hypothetical protein D3C76_1135100 [compost metagenome]
MLKLPGDALQALGHPLLLFEQGIDGALAFGAGLLRLFLALGALAGVPGEAGQGALLFKGLAQQRRAVAAVLSGRSQRQLRGAQAFFQFGLLIMEIELLLGKLLDLHGQGVELSAQFGLADELMALGCQLFQADQFQAFVGQGVPIGLGLLQLLGGAGVFILQQAQVAQPGVLLLQLLELRLLGLE